MGEALRTGVRAAISELYKEAPEKAAKLNEIDLDLNGVRNKWWLGSKESSELVAERIAEIFAQAPLRPSPTTVTQCTARSCTAWASLHSVGISARGRPHRTTRHSPAHLQVQFTPHGSVVLVGHSHYFREALKHFRAADCTLAAADGASMDSAQLDHKKLSNAGVIK